MRFCLAAALSAIVSLAPGLARAQATLASEVHIYVTLSDSVTRYYPVPDHRLIIFRSARDSVIVRTDSSGSTTIQLPQGQYRLVSAAPVSWHGYNYSWNVPIVVRGSTTMIDLRAPDAAGSIATGHAADVSRSSVPAVTDEPSLSAPQIRQQPNLGDSRKDPAVAFLFSLLITGGGDVYAHAYGNAALSWGMSVLGLVVWASALDDVPVCFGSGLSRSCTTTADTDKAALGASMVFAAWVTSMIDAPISARRYNREHGFDPVVGLDRRGATRLGLAFRF